MGMTDVNVCTTDDFAKCVGALVYYVDLGNEECKIACPNLLFDRNIIGGHGVMCSVLTLTVGNKQGMGGVEFGKVYGICFSPEFLRLSVACPAASGHGRGRVRQDLFIYLSPEFLRL